MSAISTSYSVTQTLYSGEIPVISSPVNDTNTSATFASNDHLERVKKSQFILEKYPDRVPLIIQPSKNDRTSYPIDKSKYITLIGPIYDENKDSDGFLYITYCQENTFGHSSCFTEHK